VLAYAVRSFSIPCALYQNDLLEIVKKLKVVQERRIAKMENNCELATSMRPERLATRSSPNQEEDQDQNQNENQDEKKQ
jgi:hypothetical protein